MIVYFADSEKAFCPVPIECEKFGYPNRDAHGNTMYDNTHFLDESKAWESILANCKAGVSMAARSYEQAKVDVERTKTRLANDSLILYNVEESYEVWMRNQATAPLLDAPTAQNERDEG